MKIKNIRSSKKKRGMTLIELLLAIGFISAASAVIYGVYAKADDMQKIENELRTISTFMNNVEAISESRGSFTGISSSTLDSFGLDFNSGLGSFDISTPNPSTINIEYKGINERVCSGLIMQAEGKLGTVSVVKLKANGKDLPAPVNPVSAAQNCNKNRNGNVLTISLSKLTDQSTPIVEIAQNNRPVKAEPVYPTFGVNVPAPTFQIPEKPEFLLAEQPAPGVYVGPPPAPNPPLPNLVPGDGSSSAPGQAPPPGGIEGTPSEPVEGSGGGNFGGSESTGIPDGYLEITEVCMYTKYVLHHTTASTSQIVSIEGPSPTLCVEFTETTSDQSSFLLDWVESYIVEDGGNGYMVPTFYSKNGTTETFQNAHAYLAPYIRQLQLMGAQLPLGQRFNPDIPTCANYNYFLNQTGPRVYFPETGTAGLTNSNYRPTVVTETEWNNTPKTNNSIVLYVDKQKQSDC